MPPSRDIWRIAAGGVIREAELVQVLALIFR